MAYSNDQALAACGFWVELPRKNVLRAQVNAAQITLEYSFFIGFGLNWFRG
jgi:hypothetical protein